MKNKPPAFQFYVKDWLSSPTVRMMSAAARAAYIDLLATAWDSDPIATIPNKPNELWRLANVMPEEWAQVKDDVLACFEPFEDDPTRLVNLRLRRQWLELQEFSEKQAHRASRRWKKEDKQPKQRKPAKPNGNGLEPEPADDLTVNEDAV
jgi:uncharacterized protein YdaU (DUF1376 family)